MTDILVSILMPAYNVAAYIEDAVTSILNQTYENFELIIADDASTDSTFDIIKLLAQKDPRIKYYRQQENLGFVGNKNFLLSKATGEYITFQDSDDVSHPQRITASINNILAGNNLICGTGYFSFSDASSYSFSPLPLQVRASVYNNPVDNYKFWYPTLIFHKSVLEKVGNFNPYFNGSLGEDFYWTIHANKDYPICYIDFPLYGYRNNPSSTTNTFKLKTLLMPLILKELFRQFTNTGHDWLAKGEIAELYKYESKLLANKRIMAEQYRIWAAKAVDKGDKKLASQLIKKSFSLYPLNKDLYRTVLYYLKKL